MKSWGSFLLTLQPLCVRNIQYCSTEPGAETQTEFLCLRWLGVWLEKKNPRTFLSESSLWRRQTLWSSALLQDFAPMFHQPENQTSSCCSGSWVRSEEGTVLCSRMAVEYKSRCLPPPPPLLDVSVYCDLALRLKSRVRLTLRLRFCWGSSAFCGLWCRTICSTSWRTRCVVPLDSETAAVLSFESPHS